MPAPGYSQFCDKVPNRSFAGYDAAEDFRRRGVRVVPPAIARRGSFFAQGRRADAVRSPTSAPTSAKAPWSTPGPPSVPARRSASTCHLSGGAGIGGVLEPLQASPAIIEDHCFIGARSEVVEGVVVEATIQRDFGMGVFLGQSTQHLRPRHRRESAYGRIPAGYSVVVAGNRCRRKDGSHMRSTAP